MSARLRAARARLAAQRGRSLLAAAGIFAAAAMIGTAVTVSYGLATGYERAAERADLPDVLARFEARELGEVDERLSTLPNVESRSYRFELSDEFIGTSDGEETTEGATQIVYGGRRGYAIVAGRDLSGEPGEVVVERGVAGELGVDVGDELLVEEFGPLDVVGIAVGPDDVAYPLSSDARVYVAGPPSGERPVNVAAVWASDPTRLDPLLVQARAVSFGLEDLEFVTRAGLRELVDQAAGIVIALLIAFSLVALVASGVMLSASARADVQRRLETIGVLRAIGFSRLAIAGRYAAEAALVAVPAGALGLLAGALVAAGPSARLLEALNELPPGAALLGPLAVSLAAIVALVVAATTWPAWRAAGRAPAETLRGGELRYREARRSRAPGGPFGLGIRLALARRGRALAAAAVVATAAAVVLLMLGMASFLDRLQNDPGTVGKRYQLTVPAAPAQAPELEALDGVAAASPRYSLEVVSSFNLGQPFRLIAYPGEQSSFEAPPLAEGRRLDSPREAEVGVELASALGLEPGSTLAAQLPSGDEARFRVAGVVRTLENDGLLAYVGAADLLAAEPGVEAPIAVRLSPGADAGVVAAAIGERGGEQAPAPEPVGGAAPDDRAFLGILADVLRVVAAVNLLICLYALIQSLALTVLERRAVVAVLRSAGARRGTIALMLLGTALVVVALAAPLAVLAEGLVLAPTVARLAAGYAEVPLIAAPAQIALVVAALLALAAGAAVWVARRVERQPIVAGLTSR